LNKVTDVHHHRPVGLTGLTLEIAKVARGLAKSPVYAKELFKVPQQAEISYIGEVVGRYKL